MKGISSYTLSFLLAGPATAFAPITRPISRQPFRASLSHQALHSTKTVDTETTSNNPIAGIAPFEEWFASNSSNGAHVSNIRHAMFQSDSLRGLEFTSKSSQDLNRVAVIPRKMVLTVPYSEENDDWDTKLSCMLVEECRKGKDSLYYGCVSVSICCSLSSIVLKQIVYFYITDTVLYLPTV